MSIDQFQRYGVGVSASAISAQSGTVVFSNSNSVSFGMSAIEPGSYALTMSVNANGGLAISAGSTLISTGDVVISNSNGFVFGMNGQTITAAIQNMSYWNNGVTWDAFSIVGSSSASNFSVQRAFFWTPINATRADLVVSMNAASSVTGQYTMSLGIYTLVNSTQASLASSVTQVVSWVSGSSTNQSSAYGGQSGPRWQSLSLGTWGITPGDYMFGVMFSQVSQISLTLVGSASGNFGAVSLTGGGNISDVLLFGALSVGTPSLPGSFAASQINNTQLVTNFAGTGGQPFIQLAGTY